MKPMKHCVLKKQLICCFCFLLVFITNIPIYGQNNSINITGIVSDAATGETLIGVSIYPKNEPTKGTLTDVDGQYSITVTQGTTLVVSYLGYVQTEIIANSATMNISLKEQTTALDEVVVIGYGTVKRKDVTTAVSTVSTADIDQRPIVSAAQAIQGRAAGVSVIQPNGAPGGRNIDTHSWYNIIQRK